MAHLWASSFQTLVEIERPALREPHKEGLKVPEPLDLVIKEIIEIGPGIFNKKGIPPYLRKFLKKLAQPGRGGELRDWVQLLEGSSKCVGERPERARLKLLVAKSGDFKFPSNASNRISLKLK